MMSRNKKGIVMDLFSVALAVFTLVALWYTYESYAQDGALKNAASMLGKESLTVLQTAQDAERRLFFLDQVGKYATVQSIKSVNEHGGFYQGICSVEEGYTVWNKECMPDVVHLQESMQRSLTEIVHSVSLSSLQLPDYQHHFDVYFEEGKTLVFGWAKDTIAIPRGNLDYKVTPNFKVVLPFDFRVYEALVKSVEQRVDCLQKIEYNALTDDSKKLKETCGFGVYDWSITKKNTFAFFDVTSKDWNILQEQIHIKFAIDLNTFEQSGLL